MTFWREAAVMAAGGTLYWGLEILWRGRSHWSMAALGGVCFWGIGRLQAISPGSPLWARAVVGAAAVTALELAAGLAVNRRRQIWDYSGEPKNWNGQICLRYSLLWVPASAMAAVAEEQLRALLP